MYPTTGISNKQNLTNFHFFFFFFFFLISTSETSPTHHANTKQQTVRSRESMTKIRNEDDDNKLEGQGKAY